MLPGRACWAFVRRAHAWDSLAALRWAAARAPDLAPAALGRLDAALHAERYTPRLAYGQLLAGFKLHALAGCTEPSAAAVCQARARQA
jgi:hypothetical protein